VRAKEEVLRSGLGSDVARLTELLVAVCERRRRFRDFTRTELREALIAVAARTDAYRSYMKWTDAGEAVRTPEDSAFVRRAIGAARAARPLLDPEVFDLLQLVLGFGATGAAEQELAARFQQLTGPTMAKGEEDTALYRACRLLALDDVGHDPGTFSLGPDAVHAWAGAVAAAWPRTMLTTSTHDTKRSEDVRARLAVLAEIPEEVVDLSSRVCARAAARFDVDGHTSWFMVQTLVGAWPATRERLWGALAKSYREAELRTSWLHPDDAYEQAAAALLDDLLTDPVASRAIERIVDLVHRPGQANSLALTTLRCTLPGVPDTYQGCDRWQLTLVDPDNRRSVDLAAHHELLRAGAGRTPADLWAEQAADGRSSSVGLGDGAVKQALLRELLHLRGRGRWAFGTYEPLAVTAAEPAPAVAYARADDVIVVVPRFSLHGAAALTTATIDLPTGPWRDVCTGGPVAGGATVTVASLTSRFPVAVLERAQ
jgi:(1->4)-alpha-D-glucan 1-alpha-D-glucosylmutase